MKTAHYRHIIAYLLIFSFILPWFSPGLSYAEDAGDSPLISVKLVNYVGNATELAVDLTGSYQLKDNGTKLGAAAYRIKAEQNSLALYQGDKVMYRGLAISLSPETYSTNSYVKIKQRPYLGELKFELENGLFVRPINTLPLEDYLKGVVPLEMPAAWSVEALKAQAIAARTYAMGKINRVIDDTVNFQVYGGFQWHENSTRAVEQTKGQVLKLNGAFIEALYSSSNGGHTEASESLWNKVAYLPAQADPYDPQNRWTLTFKKQQIALDGKDLHNPDVWWKDVKEADPGVSNTIKKWLQQNGYENLEIKIVSISSLAFYEDKTKGGRIKTGSIGLEFVAKHQTNGYQRNMDGSIQVIRLEKSDIPATSLRAMLGGGNVFKSYLVESIQQDEISYTIQGRGFGHGVGMSQYGAKSMAEQGKKVNEILSFYYPGTTLTESKGAVIASSPELTAPPIIPAVPIQHIPGNKVLGSLKLSSPTFTIGSDKRIQIQYQLQQPATVSVLIYDSQGTVRRVLTNGANQSEGTKIVSWDGYGLSAGNYNLVVEAKDENGAVSSVASKIQFLHSTTSRTGTLAKTGVVKSTVLIGLRTQANFQTKPVKLLKNGDSVQIISKQDRWYKVKSGATVGFVPDQYIVGKKY